MPLLVGIDEAGVGPDLGPLVATAVTFQMPEELLAASLWELFSPLVGQGRRALPIADSKLLYRGQGDRAGFCRLEKGVLAVLAVAGGVPATMDELLARLIVPFPAARRAAPWDTPAALPLPRVAAVGQVLDLATAFAARLEKLLIAPPKITCQVVQERLFNRLLTRSGSKGELLLRVDARLLRRLPAGAGRVHLDRLGGRRHYRDWLQRTFASGFVWVLEEGSKRSGYLVHREDGSALEVWIAVGCERRQLPVALASMVAKYVRELYMELFNGYWQRRVSGVAPTAGYPADASRFVRAIAAAAQREGMEPSQLLRQRHK